MHIDLNNKRDKSKRPRSINNINEVDEIDEIFFRPITDGLGFKKETDGEIVIRRAKAHKKNYEIAIGKEKRSTLMSDSIPAELNAFYTPKKRKHILNKEIKFNEKIIKKASRWDRYVSFIFDVIICILFSSLIFSLMFISTNLSLNSFYSLLLIDYNLIFPFIMMLIIFNVYFISIGYRQSIGEKTLLIKRDYRNTVESSYMHIVKRANFYFLSLFLLGIPILLDLDLKLSKVEFNKL